MVLTEQEKRERQRQAVRRYQAKIKEKAKKGDDEAKKQQERNRYNTAFSHTRNFILKQAKKHDLPKLRDLISERQKQLLNKK